MAEKGMLTIIKGFGRGTIYRLGERAVTAGRDTGNLIQIIDDSISRRHVMIRWIGGVYELVDLNSSNGTFVNNQQVTKAILNMGDVISVGETELELVPDRQDVRDSILDRKVADQRITAGETRYVAPDQQQAGQAAAGPVNIDEQMSVNEMNVAKEIYRLSSEDNYLDISLAIIVNNINPDRTLIFKYYEGTKLRSVATFINPELDEQLHGVRPVFDILVQASTRGKPVLNNYIEGTYPEERRIATAAAVSLGDRAGMIYIDSFVNRKKFFMDFDITLLEKVAKTISARLT
ncbi:MAG: FHA domain-containing protein [Pseudomonadota bacterium]